MLALNLLKQHSKLLSTMRTPLLVLLYCDLYQGRVRSVLPTRASSASKPTTTLQPTAELKAIASCLRLMRAINECPYSVQPADRPYSSAQKGHPPPFELAVHACTSTKEYWATRGSPCHLILPCRLSQACKSALSISAAFWHTAHPTLCLSRCGSAHSSRAILA